jgi:uncharacterized membrane protein YkvA (DUF1232 family)
MDADDAPVFAAAPGSRSGRFDRDLWRKVRRTLGRVPFVEDAVAAWYCTRDPATPTRVKAIALAALAYFVMPADMIPDFLVGLGFTDDAAVIYATLRAIRPHLKDRHHEQARRALDLDGTTPTKSV